MDKFRDTRDLPLLAADHQNLVLFHPHIPEAAISAVTETLRSRWIGQGPKVDSFEEKLVTQLGLSTTAIAVGAGTDALHLAFLLAGLQPGDEVIAPVFTCTATNIPLLYLGVDIKFADIQPNTLNLDPAHVRQLVSERTKAIVCVHYGGLPCDLDELRSIADEFQIPIIEDAAQALGATYKGRPIGDISEFTIFSFQAIKHLTTGDGGMLLLRDHGLREKAERMRWFGIDRSAKQGGTWSNEISEIGYKYQMTDIGAAMGLAGLDCLDEVLSVRRTLFQAYQNELSGIPGLELIGANLPDREHAAWLMTMAVDRRRDLERKLRDHRVESGQVHFRNDRYKVFEKYRTTEVPNMDAVEDRYLVLPLHMKVTLDDVGRVGEVIRSGW